VLAQLGEQLLCRKHANYKYSIIGGNSNVEMQTL